jgi:hypothetical protein
MTILKNLLGPAPVVAGTANPLVANHRRTAGKTQWFLLKSMEKESA